MRIVRTISKIKQIIKTFHLAIHIAQNPYFYYVVQEISVFSKINGCFLIKESIREFVIKRAQQVIFSSLFTIRFL
jgi:hypothetical protein